MADKMHAVITDDAWNGQQPYSCASQLTSTSKTWRQRWKGRLRGGTVIAGDLSLVPHADFSHTPPKPPRPRHLPPPQMRQLAIALQRLLTL
jgi:hypothetical protein